MKRYPRHHARGGQKRKSTTTRAEAQVRRHPIYGEIPLVRSLYVDLHGVERELWRYDATFKPTLPKDAVRGDPARQVFCYHHVPKYFYVDEGRACIQCGQPFVFRAAEQKHWYEALQFNFHSVPVRCLRCRRRRRSEHALGEQVGRARAATQADAADPDAWLALARAVVENHRRTGRGRPDEAIAAARRAARLWPESSEPLLWEGLAQALAGRGVRARAALREYIERGQGRGQLLSRAQLAMAALENGGLSG